VWVPGGLTIQGNRRSGDNVASQSRSRIFGVPPLFAAIDKRFSE
jgi:hypothetical protein